MGGVAGQGKTGLHRFHRPTVLAFGDFQACLGGKQPAEAPQLLDLGNQNGVEVALVDRQLPIARFEPRRACHVVEESVTKHGGDCWFFGAKLFFPRIGDRNIHPLGHLEPRTVLPGHEEIRALRRDAVPQNGRVARPAIQNRRQ